MLEVINLNGNPIPQEKDQFTMVIDSLSLIGQNHFEGDGGLKELSIHMTREDQVDYILRKFPKLEKLNPLPVDRNELYSSQEEVYGEDRDENENDDVEDS